MYFPDPTKKPTAKDYQWAGDLRQDNFRLRFDWVVMQIALRGQGEKSFCQQAGLNPDFIGFIRSGKRQGAHQQTWQKLIDHLIKTEMSVPTCLWRRQNLFPYRADHLPQIMTDMNLAGFTAHALQRWRGTDSPKSILGRAKNVGSLQWFESLSLLYATLDGLPVLTQEMQEQFFPYRPEQNPAVAQLQLQKLWQLQEASGACEHYLSAILGKEVNLYGGQSYVRAAKFNKTILPVQDYVILVRVLQRDKFKNAAQKVTTEYQDYFPFSQDARQDLALRAVRLGVTYQAVFRCAQNIFGKEDSFSESYASQLLRGDVRIPSQKIWHQVVLAIQEAESQVKATFLKHWKILYGANGPHRVWAGNECPERAFNHIVKSGDSLNPIPTTWLAPALMAGITWGGRFGKPFKPSKDSRFQGVVLDVNASVSISQLGRNSISVNPDDKLMVHRRADFYSPITVTSTEDLKRHGVILIQGCRANRTVRSTATIRPARCGSKQGKTL